MEMEKEPLKSSWKKPIPDYANQEYVDIDKRVKDVDAMLVAGHSEEERDRKFDLYHDVVKLEPSQEQEIEGLSVPEINAITEDLKKKMATIERAKENVRKMIGSEIVDKLKNEVNEMKMMVFEESGVTEKTYSIEEGDNKETVIAKNKLRAVWEYIQNM